MSVKKFLATDFQWGLAKRERTSLIYYDLKTKLKISRNIKISTFIFRVYVVLETTLLNNKSKFQGQQVNNNKTTI